MTLHVCGDCGTAYLAAAVCPQCGGGVYRFDWEEEEMPRATVEGGGSAGAPQDVEVVDLSGDAREVVREAIKPKTPAKPKPAPAAAGK